MNDRAALQAAILAQPGEDTPRLALADWLDEHGDQADAELRERTRVAEVPSAQLRGRTRVVRDWSRYAARLLAETVPKSWVVWPIEYPSEREGTWNGKPGKIRVRGSMGAASARSAAAGRRSSWGRVTG